MKRRVLRTCVAACTALLIAAVPVVQAKDLTGKLEIFSWWAGDEGPALQALIDLYNKDNSGVEVINATVTGGSGVNAKAVLKTRMLGGEPPDSFQVHAGQELIGTWVAADRMEDLTPLFKEQGWMEVFPEGLIKNIGTDKGIWSVPVNIHRSNVLWYSPAHLEKWELRFLQPGMSFLKSLSNLRKTMYCHWHWLKTGQPIIFGSPLLLLLWALKTGMLSGWGNLLLTVLKV